MTRALTVDEVRKVGVIGAGLMGHGIAQVFALAGYPVTLYDVQQERLDAAVAGIRENLALFEREGVVTADEAEAAVGLVRTSADLQDAVGDADFIMEAVFEDIEVKRAVMRQLDGVCPAHTVFASNSSGLNVNDMGPATNRPDKVVVAHFWNPPHILPLVEIVVGDLTAPETVQLTADLLTRAGKRPVVLKRHIPGFIGNRLQYALFREAVSLVQMGVCTPEDVDTVVEMSFGRRLTTAGPLKTADINGLDLFYRISQYLYQDLDRSTQPHPVLAERIAAGCNGVRSGRGFFDWPPERVEEIKRRRDDELIRWMKVDRQRGHD